MCGIAGFLDPRAATAREVMQRRAGAMSDALAHRGPDAAGTWVDPAAGIALGHRRLAIIDLSAAGAQPMRSASGRHVISYNGEIYNFPDLRRRLEGDGVVLRGRSDTEVLVEAIDAWGLPRALEAADGMFAFALWDRRERRLALARDRLGEKPLYYGWHGGLFLFASELKAFHAWAGFHPEVDRDALALYLRHNYLPDPHCIYRGLHKLEPGSWVAVAASEAAAAPERYWSLQAVADAARARPFAGTFEQGVDALEQTLGRSVARRMVADVPLGAFLSGGIDSSTVVALMQAHGAAPVRTFSIGFEDAGYDEAPQARAVAAHLGTDHTEAYVTPEDARAVIPSLPDLYDEPFADSSQIPTFLVSRIARRDVTVVMSGDGGDELFGGYLRYTLAAATWRRSAWLPRPLRSAAAALLRALPPATWDRLFALAAPLLPRRLAQRTPGDKLHKFARLLACSDGGAMYRALVSLWQDPQALVPGAREPRSVLDAEYPPAGDAAFVEQMMLADSVHYLPGDILAKVDRASMGVSLEARVPMLDPQVVELAWRLPHAWKVAPGQGKRVLRALLARHLPPALFERPKMGFGVPIDAWLRGPLRPWAEDLLAPARLRSAGFFDPAPIAECWRAHLGGRENRQYQLWGILMFEAWRERRQDAGQAVRAP